MATGTSINAFMDMSIQRFYEFNEATCEVLRARNEARANR